MLDLKMLNLFLLAIKYAIDMLVFTVFIMLTYRPVTRIFLRVVQRGVL